MSESKDEQRLFTPEEWSVLDEVLEDAIGRARTRLWETLLRYQWDCVAKGKPLRHQDTFESETFGDYVGAGAKLERLLELQHSIDVKMGYANPESSSPRHADVPAIQAIVAATNCG